jgi:integrase
LRTGIALNFHLGLRPGELAGLRWTDRVGGVAKIRRTRSMAGRKVVEGEPKTTNGRRDVPLSPAADALWKALQARQRVVGLDGYLFAIDGEPIHPEKFSELFAKLQDEFLVERPALKKLRFYDTRHMAITLWLRAGIDLRLVSRMAGHSSMYFTADTYSEVLDSDLSNAAEKMGTLFGS